MHITSTFVSFYLVALGLFTSGIGVTIENNGILFVGLVAITMGAIYLRKWAAKKLGFLKPGRPAVAANQRAAHAG